MTIGVDVSKDHLVWGERQGPTHSIDNSPKAVNRFLAGIGPDALIAMEATGRYHRLLADTAYLRGLGVYVFNPRDVNRYAKSISPRASTDPIAARVIAEFASIRTHRLYTPAPAFADKLKDLVRSRAGLVKRRVALAEQAGQYSQIACYLRAAAASIKQCVAKLDRDIVKVAKPLPEFALLDGIPGFGQLTAAYMVAMLASGEFGRSDSFVAFIGLDLRVKESGKFAGKRKLSKRGDPEARRLLYLAALAASRQSGPFCDLRARYLSRGFTKTEAAVFVARKLARVAWAIYTKHQPYDADRVLNQPCAKPSTQPGHKSELTYAAPNVRDKQIANTVLARARSGSFHNNQERDKPKTASAFPEGGP